MFMELVVFICGVLVMLMPPDSMLIIGGWLDIIIELGAIFPIGAGPMVFNEFVFMALMESAPMLFIELVLIPIIEFVAMPFLDEPVLPPVIVLDVISFMCMELVVIIEPPIMFMFPVWGESSATAASGRVKAKTANDTFIWMVFFIWISGFCVCCLRYQG